MWSSTETVMMEQEAGCCQDGSDLRRLLARHHDDYVQWHQYVNRLVLESGLSYRKLAEKCGLSKTTLRDWCVRGTIPKSRDSLIKFGFGLGMTAEQINRLLMYGGGFHRLYPRDLSDAACIFVLNLRQNGGDYQECDYSLAMSLCCDAQRMNDGGALDDGRSDAVLERSVGDEDYSDMETQVAMNRLALVNNRQEFLEFVNSMGLWGRDAQGKRYRRLVAYLQDFIDVRLRERSRQEDMAVSWHGLARDWGSNGELEKMMSCLKHRGMVPRRDRLIALGLRLEMTMPELNVMLDYAGMEGLYARDKLECVLIYALQNVELSHPEIAFDNALQLQQVSKDPLVRRQCLRLIEEYMERSYREEDGDWTELSQYICGILEELDLPEGEVLLDMLR